MKNVIPTVKLADGSRKIVDVSEVFPVQDGGNKTFKLMGWRMTSKRFDSRLVVEFVKKAVSGYAEDARLAGIRW